jgi:hypothetical protein
MFSDLSPISIIAMLARKTRTIIAIFLKEIQYTKLGWGINISGISDPNGGAKRGRSKVTGVVFLKQRFFSIPFH